MHSSSKKIAKYKLTLTKEINRKKEKIDGKLEILKGIPLFNWIEISPIDACNRKCVFCPKSDPVNYPNTFKKMDNDLVKKLAKELKSFDYKGTVIFAGYGEPLLDKNIFEKINHLSTICNTEVTTNGDPLNKKVIKQLIDSGIGKIIVSLYDGPEQILKFEKLFKECDVKDNKYILRDRWYKEDEGFGLMLTNRAGTLKFESRNTPENTTGKCYYPHYGMIIDWDGSVYLCPHDWNRENKNGNITNENILDIWNSNNFNKFRKNLCSGKRVDEPCSKCNVHGLIYGENHASAWENYYKKN